VPPSGSTLKALAVFSYLLKHVKETNVADHYGTPSAYTTTPRTQQLAARQLNRKCGFICW
jgi:hypothetical protein